MFSVKILPLPMKEGYVSPLVSVGVGYTKEQIKCIFDYGFYEEIVKVFFQLSSNIKYAATTHSWQSRGG